MKRNVEPVSYHLQLNFELSSSLKKEIREQSWKIVLSEAGFLKSDILTIIGILRKALDLFDIVKEIQKQEQLQIQSVNFYFKLTLDSFAYQLLVANVSLQGLGIQVFKTGENS